MPDGHIIPEYFVLEYPDWINTIAISKEGAFILVRQYRHAIGISSFELCAGVAEENEDPLDAAKRELLEETGFGGGHWERWMKIAPNPATSNNWVHCFLATGVEKLQEPDLDAGEQITVHLFSKDKLREMVKNTEIIQATHLAPLWKYFALNPE